MPKALNQKSAVARPPHVQSLPKLNSKWPVRCISLASRLKVPPADIFWGVRFAEDLEFFTKVDRKRLEVRYRVVFEWLRETRRVLHGKEVRHG